MHQHGVEPVQRRPPLAPGQRVHGLVTGDDVVEVRHPEHPQQRQILLAMPAVRGRVDEDRALVVPHQVAPPQVTVDAGGRLVVVELAVEQLLHQPLEHRQLRRRVRAGAPGQFGHGRGDAVVGPEFAERRARRQLHRPRVVERAEPAVAVPSLGGRAESGCAGVVRAGERFAEGPGFA